MDFFSLIQQIFIEHLLCGRHWTRHSGYNDLQTQSQSLPSWRLPSNGILDFPQFPSGNSALWVCSFITMSLRPRWEVSVRSAKGQLPYNACVRGKEFSQFRSLNPRKRTAWESKKCAVICQSRVLTYNPDLMQSHWFRLPLISPWVFKDSFKGSLLLSSIRMVMPLAKMDQVMPWFSLRISRAFASCCKQDLCH